MDIDGMGEEIVRRLVESGRVSDVADYYTLDEVELAQLQTGRTNKEGEPMLPRADGCEEAGSGHRRIAHAPVRPPAVRLGHAACGQNHGRGAGARVPEHGRARWQPPRSELAAVDGVGPKIAHSTYLFLRTPDNVSGYRAIARSTACAMADDVEAQAVDALPQTLEGLTFVLTGSLTHKRYEARRGRCGAEGPRCEGVGAACRRRPASWLLARRRAAKYDKAVALGVPVLDEAALLHIIETGEAPTADGE